MVNKVEVQLNQSRCHIDEKIEAWKKQCLELESDLVQQYELQQQLGDHEEIALQSEVLQDVQKECERIETDLLKFTHCIEEAQKQKELVIQHTVQVRSIKEQLASGKN